MDSFASKCCLFCLLAFVPLAETASYCYYDYSTGYYCYYYYYYYYYYQPNVGLLAGSIVGGTVGFIILLAVIIAVIRACKKSTVVLQPVANPGPTAVTTGTIPAYPAHHQPYTGQSYPSPPNQGWQQGPGYPPTYGNTSAAFSSHPASDANIQGTATSPKQ